METTSKYAYAKSIIQAVEDGKCIEIKNYNKWEPYTDYEGNSLLLLNDPGLIRIKPDTTYVPLEQEDIPPVCWVTSCEWEGSELMIIALKSTGIVIPATNGPNFMSFQNMFNDGKIKYSSNRKNWSPCRKMKV